jgi:hypothetical protein
MENSKAAWKKPVVGIASQGEVDNRGRVHEEMRVGPTTVERLVGLKGRSQGWRVVLLQCNHLGRLNFCLSSAWGQPRSDRLVELGYSCSSL